MIGRIELALSRAEAAPVAQACDRSMPVSVSFHPFAAAHSVLTSIAFANRDGLRYDRRPTAFFSTVALSA